MDVPQVKPKDLTIVKALIDEVHRMEEVLKANAALIDKLALRIKHGESNARSSDVWQTLDAIASNLRQGCTLQLDEQREQTCAG